MQQSMHLDQLTLGVCYYPEHWPEELWADDLKRMQQNGIRVIRVAEFAWNKFEPQEGVYSYEFWDRFMDLAESSGIKVIFCTPTATPPAWMTEKYPEVLNATQDGLLFRHGMRRHYNYNSPVYREFTRKITEMVAEHYSRYSCVIGWQIDNEINCGTSEFYSEADQLAFREWVKRRYQTLERLNQAWGTVFWNQTYTSWEEVFLPRFTGERRSPNPHMVLDSKRFFSDSAVSYCKLQYDIIKKYAAPRGQFVTTNGMFDHLDYDELVGNAVDFITYDCYPAFGFESLGGSNNRGFDDDSPADSRFNLNDRKWGWFLSNARAFSPVFGVMEQQSGAGGWVNRVKPPAPRPGQIRLWSFQSLAHGADFVSYFRWRTCTFGTEIYWHGILDYSNRDNRKLSEIDRVHRDFQAVGEVVGAQHRGRIALIRDYDNLWDGEYDIWHGPLRNQSEVGWYVAAQLTHTPMDIVYLCPSTTAETLAQYDLVVYPHPTIATEGTAALLKQYVQAGGQLIAGARSGYKDADGHCYMMDMPGHLRELFGVRVDDFSNLCYKDAGQTAVWGRDSMQMPLFNDILTPEGREVEVLATYRGNYYDGQAAFTRNRYGEGSAYYFGAAFEPETTMLILRKLGIAEPYAGRLELPECCGLEIREKAGTEYHFVLNFSDQPERIVVKQPMTDLITGTAYAGDTVMPAYGVLVLK